MIKLLQLIFRLFFSSKKVEPKQEEIKPKPISLKYEFTMSEYLMGRDVKYPINEEQTANAVKLLNKVNLIMNEFYTDNTQLPKRPLTSGYRPAEINATVKGASKTSHHTRCAAIDIADADKQLANWLKLKEEEILVKYDLYMENTDITKTWVHFQIYAPRSGNRIFNP